MWISLQQIGDERLLSGFSCQFSPSGIHCHVNDFRLKAEATIPNRGPAGRFPYLESRVPVFSPEVLRPDSTIRFLQRLRMGK
jgi:hypothetical protein